MSLEQLMKDFVTTSIEVGLDAGLVQGGGGNTSLKLDQNRMVIKASGFLLKNMSLEDGYSIVDYPAINNYLESPDESEDVFTKRIKSNVVETSNRPSIETGFHSVLGRSVIHSHSVYANTLTCSETGFKVSKELFPNSIWVDYASPGRELTLKIKNLVSDINKEDGIILFLQNHGLIISHRDPLQAKFLHKSVNSKISDFLKLPAFKVDYSRLDYNLSMMNEKVLFPDQIVYTMSDADVLESDAAKETLASYEYLLSQITSKGLNPSFLNKCDVDFIMNMESEKFRLKVLKNENHSSPS